MFVSKALSIRQDNACGKHYSLFGRSLRHYNIDNRCEVCKTFFSPSLNKRPNNLDPLQCTPLS